MSEPPKDGSDQVLEITVKVDAYWCDYLNHWILCRPCTYERLPSSARYIAAKGEP